MTASQQVRAALLATAVLACVPTSAVRSQEVEVPPEDPLPPPPPELAVAPVQPVVVAPDARDLLIQCADPTFTDCFRNWRPPPPPPPPPPAKDGKRDTAAAPPDPNTPVKPAEPGGADPAPKPPVPDAATQAAKDAADRATYEALVRAVKETGLEGKIVLPEPPKAAASPSPSPAPPPPAPPAGAPAKGSTKP